MDILKQYLGLFKPISAMVGHWCGLSFRESCFNCGVSVSSGADFVSGETLIVNVLTNLTLVICRNLNTCEPSITWIKDFRAILAASPLV